MLVARFFTNPSHLKLKVLILVFVVDQVYTISPHQSHSNRRISLGVNRSDLHSSKLHNAFSHSDCFSSLHFLVHNLLKLSLRQCLAFSNRTCPVAVVYSRRLKAEKFRTGLVNAANEGRETKWSDRTVRRVRLEIC